MKKHSGMRPHDIVILLKISVLPANSTWYLKDLAFSLEISSSEISESVNRSMIAGLMANDKKTVMKSALLEFLEHGLKYVFPVKPALQVRGIATATSAPLLNHEFNGDIAYAWSKANGQMTGYEIEPLHKNVASACLKDKKLYEVMAMTEAIRIGKVREQKIALKFLQKRILNVKQ